MQSTVSVYVLFKGGFRGELSDVCGVSVRAGTNVTAPRSLATSLDLKWVGSGFMVSCYSITLLSAALFGAVLECVRWYMMCHCSSNLGFSSVEHSVLFISFYFFFLLRVHDSAPAGENIAHPLFFLSFLFSVFFPPFCDSTLLGGESNTSRFWCSWFIFRRGSLRR